MIESNIDREEQTVFVRGPLRPGSKHFLLARIHQAVEKEGYQELVLDFSECNSAFPGPMLAICAQVARLRENGIYSKLLMPTDSKLHKLFVNTNWANLLDPRSYDPSFFKGYSQVPTTQFKTPEQQKLVVDKIMDAALSAVHGLERTDFAAFEWAINELTDNVLTHSESTIGGLVQVSTFRKKTKRVEFVIADSGIGIPFSLRQSRAEITSDTEALNEAIREGVTRDKALGQGNGLYGSWRVCNLSGGQFFLDSGYARLANKSKGDLRVESGPIPYKGALISAVIDFSNPGILESALSFGDSTHATYDYIEQRFEEYSMDDLVFRFKDEAASLGSRLAGTPVRQKLMNISRMSNGRKIHLDFSDIALVSSSFADEVIGKAFAELGTVGFKKKFELANMSPIVKQIVERAIQQRLNGTRMN